MTFVRTATGKQFPCDFMGIASGYDVLYLKLDMEIPEAVSIFMNPEETETLAWYDDASGEDVRTVSGYTEFGGVTIMQPPCPVRIRMTRPQTVIQEKQNGEI